MSYFLEKTARYIVENYPDETGSICIVLPNKRGSLYLRKYLREILGKTSFTPSYQSISDLVQFLSGYTIMDPVQQLFFFYGVYKDITRDDSDDLETFMDWAPLVLSDFNDIDLYLADASEVFGYLSDARAISLWNPGKTELTPLQLKYLRFYRSLYDLYKNLNKRLSDSGLAYEGMAYRHTAKNIETISRNIPWSKIIFAGFNAFSKSEEIITSYLTKTGKAELLWDTDDWYLNDPMQEAGYFIRNHLQLYEDKKLFWKDSNLKNLERKIKVLGLPGNTAQAKMAGNIIDEWIKDGRDLNKSAIVLADEQLLLPVLNSLPEAAGSFNVTMGYPFRFTPVFNFFDNWLKLLDNSGKYTVAKPDKEILLYKNDLLNILQHPYFPLISKVANIPVLISTIIRSNNFFFSSLTISSLASNDQSKQEFLREVLFKIPESINILIGSIRQLCSRLLDELNAVTKEEHQNANVITDLEYIYHFTVIIARLGEYWETAGQEYNLNTFRKVLQKMAAGAAIPFYGEPLKGLQVMGFLETRTLDFDNLIILSMNEGVYPDGKSGNAFLSSDIRQIFGLPGNKEKTSIFAYHFYRLLQRAQNITITYLTEPDLLGGGTKSRFLEQILLEMKGNSNTEFFHAVTEFPIDGLNQKVVISIEKSDNVLNQLHLLGEKGISPSALSTYIRCPLRFYYQYVLRLDDRIEGTESLDAALLGTLVHDTLYRLYDTLQGKILSIDNMTFGKEIIHKELQNSILENYPDGNMDSGRNLLLYNVVVNIVENFINFERQNLKEYEKTSSLLTLSSLEKRYQAKLKLEIQGKEHIIIIAGKTDRIDKLNGTIRIIDYKTGAINRYDLSFASWEALKENPKYDKALQLLVYAWLYESNHHSSALLQPGIIPLRNLSEDFIPLRPLKQDYPDSAILEQTEFFLKELLQEIFDPDKPFIQTNDLDLCGSCFFKDICNR